MSLCCLLTLGQTKRALVIGLGLQEDASWGKINGDKDVPLITGVLRLAGYQQGNISTLVNQQATKRNIIIEFGKLTAKCKRNDIVYIHFSGHGQQVTDINGDENDGWDESWVSYDAYKNYCKNDRGNKHLIDDEVYRLLIAIKQKIGESGKILVCVDACHSGYSTYEPNVNRIVRGMSEPFIIPYKTYSYAVKSPERWLTLSACKSYQYNQEMKNPRVGILTYALYTLAKKGSISMELIEDFVQKNKGPLPQSPMLTGETNKYSISDVLK